MSLNWHARCSDCPLNGPLDECQYSTRLWITGNLPNMGRPLDKSQLLRVLVNLELGEVSGREDSNSCRSDSCCLRFCSGFCGVLIGRRREPLSACPLPTKSYWSVRYADILEVDLGLFKILGNEGLSVLSLWKNWTDIQESALNLDIASSLGNRWSVKVVHLSE